MIIDNLNVFTDNFTVRSNNSSVVLDLSPSIGTGDPLNVTVIVTEAYAAAVTLTVNVQDSNDGLAFSTVGSFVLDKPSRAGSMLQFPMPYNVTRPYVRLSYTVSGTTSTGKLFAALTREHFAPYGDGLYIEKGKKVK